MIAENPNNALFWHRHSVTDAGVAQLKFEHCFHCVMV